MGNSKYIYRFSYHVFRDNTDYRLIAKRILYNIRLVQIMVMEIDWYGLLQMVVALLMYVEIAWNFGGLYVCMSSRFFVES